MDRRLYNLLLLGILSLLAFGVAQAQEGDIFELGFKPYGSFEGGDIDAIDRMNHGLHVRIPIVSYPQRGGILKMQLAHSYTSQLFHKVDLTAGQSCTDACYTYDSSPYGGAGSGLVDMAMSVKKDATYPYTAWAITSTGTHKLGSWNATLDGTAYRVSTPTNSPPPCPTTQWITDRNGITHTYGCNASGASIGYYEDPNGNRITENYNSLGGRTSYTDTMNRVIPQGGLVNPTSDLSGCTGPLPTRAAYLLSFPGFAGTAEVLKLCTVTITSNIPCSGRCLTSHRTFEAEQAAVLPNGTAWVFQYDSADPNDPNSLGYGDLLKITFPTGGSLSYTYQSVSAAFACSAGGAYLRGVTSRTLDANDGQGPHTWTYTSGPGGTGFFSTIVQDPLGNDTVHTFTILSNTGFINGQTCSAYETKSQEYQGVNTGTPLRTVTTDYATAEVLPANNSEEYPAALPIRVTTVLANGQQTKVEMDNNYPLFGNGGDRLSDGNVIAQREYDYAASAPGLLRTTTKIYKDSIDGHYLNVNLVTPLASVKVTDGTGAQQSYTSFGYDESALTSSGVTVQLNLSPRTGSYRGNLTSTSQWLSAGSVSQAPCNVSVPSGGSLIARKVYFDTGVVQTSTDPCLYLTTYAYSSTYDGAYPTKVTNALNQYSSTAYDFNTGVVTSITDVNSQITNKNYDILARLTSVSYPDGGSTSYCYSDMGGATCTQSGPPYQVVMTKAITASVNEKSTVGFDGVGRESQMQLNSDVPSTTYTLATYDALGRKSQVYNPTRCNPATTNCGETTWGFTTTNYDPLNRVTSVVEEDGSTVSTDYSAFPCTTVKDETGKVRKSCVDGLGRTTKVFEAPSGLNYETDYGYDALANLLRVTQKGGTTDSTQWRIRTYTYDSLSHLVCAANPEIRNVSCPSSPTGPFPSGTVLYAYDSDGNVVTKTAPSPNQASTGTSTVATNYTYDVLNRLTGKSYADTYVSNSATSGVQYGYDGVALSGCTTAPPSLTDSYPKGERTAMCDGSGATSWAHEVMGRVAIEKRTVVGTSAWSKSAGYTYNLDGSFATISNPGIGRVMTYTMTGAGRQKSVVNTGGGINFVTNATYAPAGELATYTNGSNINTTNSYNGRFQPATLSAVNTSTGQTIISLTYDFHSSTHADNGNVFQIVNGKDGNRTQNFLYDSLNRIQQAYTNGTNWGETFGPTATAPGTLPSSPGIDAWGNLTNRSGVTGKSSSELLSVAPASNQNRLPGFGYDAAGNMISNGSASYTYDAENHLLTTAGWTYVYDGDGRRVRKSSGSTGTLYWPDLNGNVLNESSLGATNLHEYVYFGGKRVARIDVPTPLTVKYFFSDQLGSADVITDASGSILEESDYFPYGGEIAITNNDGNNYKFTGKERDAETCTTGCLDYFGARHHASSLGRFQMPDAFYKDSHVADPQSWNEYAYARNNPMRYVDPNGEKADVSTSCTTTNTQTTCNVNVSASIAVYSANGANLSQPQLDDAASQIQSSIQNAWSGSFTQDGVTYNVTTQISVSVAGSEADAMKNGAQNVIGLSNGNASATGDSYVNSRSLFSAITGRGPDTGVFNINSLAEGVAAHEFTHLLGVENKPGAVLSNTNILNDPTVPHSATASDFRWGIREAILGVNGWMNAPQNRPMRYGELWDKPSAYSGQSTVSAPWHWWK